MPIADRHPAVETTARTSVASPIPDSSTANFVMAMSAVAYRSHRRRDRRSRRSRRPDRECDVLRLGRPGAGAGLPARTKPGQRRDFRERCSTSMCLPPSTITCANTSPAGPGRASSGGTSPAGTGPWPKSGSPRVHDAIAWFDCTVHDVIEAGTHRVYIGRVAAVEAHPGEPLVYASHTYSKPAALEPLPSPTTRTHTPRRGPGARNDQTGTNTGSRSAMAARSGSTASGSRM